MADSVIGSLRRFYLFKRIHALRNGDEALSAVWQSKQEEQPGGTALPETFPKRAELVAVGYVAKLDIEGADATELAEYVELSTRDAEAVIAAAAAL